MKLSNYFVPQQGGALMTWAVNYKEKIALVGPGIGLTAEMIAGQQAAAQEIIDILNRCQQKQNELAEAKTAKKLLKSKQVKAITDAAAGYKKYAGFSENVGRELGVVSVTSTIDVTTVKPTLKVKAHPGHVSVYFNKQHMSGVTIFARLKGSTGWDELATEKTSPYLDKRPLGQAGVAETREYMARCYDGFVDVGQESDIVAMLFGG